MKEITLETTIAELLDGHEGMKEKLIEINPKFKKLNNPILRRTLAKLATVKQAAIIGGMDATDLLNRLRTFARQTPLEEPKEPKSTQAAPSIAPNWTKESPRARLDANSILNEEENPLVKAHQVLKQLKKGERLEIVSDFRPEPLIAEFQKKGFDVAVDEIDSEHFLTHIRKK